ncbi:hypothetical protein OPV22_004099 [Ensete ventricosum]|uniref:NAD-dependent epimerase/dehydratase domain-containing protein n=1 Tax=Ensete ventricosum TaxID=4639 RepID=A0AAV8S2T2_ENSVE|nr:hypothetical protein OPV22_004099 [Ensete ventricosum]
MQDSPTHRVGPTIRATFFASHKAGSPVGKTTLKATTLAPRGLFFFFLSSFSFRSVPSSDPDFHEWAVIDGLGLRTNGQNSAGLKLLIGGLLGRLCEDRGIPFAFGSGRLENRAKLEADIAAAALTHVFNAAGATCRPNVDWCEDDRVDVETIRANVVGTLTLGDVCRERGLLLVNCASGCIFEYDGAHTLGSGAGFKEEHTPNFVGSFCSKTKAMVEELLKNVCTLRVRMLISSDLSILAISLPKSPAMRSGISLGYGTSPTPRGVSHNQILEIYRDYIDPKFTWKNFNLEEQAKMIAAPRSNNELDAAKLKEEFPELLPFYFFVSPFVVWHEISPMPRKFIKDSNVHELLFSHKPLSVHQLFFQ